MLYVRFALKRPGGGRIVVAGDGIVMASRFSGENDGWSVVKSCEPALGVSAVLDQFQGYLSDFPAPIGRVPLQSSLKQRHARFACCDGDYLFSRAAITAAFGWLKDDATIKIKPCPFPLRGVAVEAILVLMEAKDRQVLLSPCVPRAGRLAEWEADWNSSAIIEVKVK